MFVTRRPLRLPQCSLGVGAPYTSTDFVLGEQRKIYKCDLCHTGNCIKDGRDSRSKLIEMKTDTTEIETDMLLDEVKFGEKDKAANILSCFPCDKLFNSAVSMEDLKRWKHGLEPDCTLCGKVFNSRM